uniref:Uncharacterized protein n=1 Tax=Solanum tuberosum TaxID=4113 RepID=M1DXM4_SOLTU
MDFLVNAVKAYFDRSWSRKDMMSLAPIPQNDRTSLNRTLFIGYFVLYSQEILYDARFGNINAVNRTLTIFFHLPAVVIHATRLCLRVKTQRRPTHRIVLKVRHRINRKQNADGEL